MSNPDPAEEVEDPREGEAVVGDGEHRDGDQGSHHLRDLVEQIEEAAIAAEFETGRREETVAEAKRHIVLRVLQVFVGSLVLLAGVAMLPLPGPGWLTIAAGLGILAPEVPFARRLLDQVRRRLPSDADGKVPRSTIVLGVVASIIGVGASLWWSFWR